MSTTPPPSYYQRHIFFCLNERQNGDDCCARHNAQAAFDRCKAQVKAAGLAGPGRVRVNKAGCLDRCEFGPTMVIYPEGVWYRASTREEVDEILQAHLVEGRRAERLEALRAELGADTVLPVVLDVRDRDAVTRAVEGLPAEWAGVPWISSMREMLRW